ncbi:MAG: cation diffusion facilitator family transporter [Actinomycetota bacterium]
MSMAPSTDAEYRRSLLRSGLRLEYLTVGWNLVEGVVAVLAALVAGSVALLGFGIDSFVESASGSVLVWRLLAERGATGQERIERVEQRAQRLVAVSLVGLVVFVTVDASRTLWLREHPDPSAVGIVLTAVSLGVMWWLARAKRRTAIALGSRAMEADAFQTTACWGLSLVVLVGVGLNAVLGWWWADPVAALGITYFLVREALEAWRGEERSMTPPDVPLAAAEGSSAPQVTEMTEPVYACSLDDEELTARRADWRALEAGALIRAETRPDGRLLVYRGGADTARVLKGLIEAERKCCSFLDFRVEAAEDEVRVTVTMPPEARPSATELGIVRQD